mmetsp:Transcript_36819/g.102172  ORF Transcript_36819/g.102172 Transcript_36819/m.102172 type:complete len:222 (+) Transcript_36819:54-719(+)
MLDPTAAPSQEHSTLQRRLLDLGELGELLVEVCVPFCSDGTLVGLLAIACVELFHDLHAIAEDFSKRREPLFVKEGIVIVVDEELGGASVWARGGKNQRPPLVAHLHRVVGDAFQPWLRLGRQPELGHEAGHHAEDACIIIPALLNQLLELSSTPGSPLGVHLDGDAGVTWRVAPQVQVKHDVKGRCILSPGRTYTTTDDWSQQCHKVPSAQAGGCQSFRR